MTPGKPLEPAPLPASVIQGSEPPESLGVDEGIREMRALHARRAASNLRGLLLMLVSTLAFAGMHGLIRLVPGEMHPFEKAFFRNGLGMVYFLPWLIHEGGASLRTGKLQPHFWRGVLNAGSALTFFMGVPLVHLATIAAVGFSAPLFAIGLASLWLKERVRARRWVALGAGIAGMLVLLRPSVGGVGLGELYLLAAAIQWALALLIIKNLARTETSMTITVYMVLFMTPLTGMAAAFYWTWPTWPQLAVLAVMAALGNLGQLALTQALKLADASLVLPLDFLRLIWGTLMGLALFGEWPDVWTWVGGAMIFASTTWLTLKETR
jgi:drug/metabolite transporter (DMT)-like permease